jgi:hypothetical protein
MRDGALLRAKDKSGADRALVTKLVEINDAQNAKWEVTVSETTVAAAGVETAA